MRRRYVPNLLSVARILMIPPAMFELVRGHHLHALIIMAVAGATDGVDGFLARRFDWRSRLGAVLDPLADKLLMMASYTTLGILGHVPMWLAVLVVGRDLVIMAGATTYYRIFGHLDIQPSTLSKLNTVFQVGLLVVVVGSLAGLPVPRAVVGLVIWLVAVSTVVSGFHYVWFWSVKAYRAAQRDG